MYAAKWTALNHIKRKKEQTKKKVRRRLKNINLLRAGPNELQVACTPLGYSNGGGRKLHDVNESNERQGEKK